MNKAYDRIGWENYPSDKTPLNERNLNKVDAATDEIDNRVIRLENVKATKIEVSPLFQEVEFDEQTGIITFTRKNGAKVILDTPMEKIALNIYYDPVTEMLTLPLIDGTQMEVDLSRLITEYEFLDSDTVAFSVGVDGKVTAIVKEGSIEEKHLRPDYLADIRLEAAKAQASQQAADASEKAAKKSETNAKASEDAAKVSETNAKASETNALNSKMVAANSASAAKISETNAKTSETNAKASEISASESGAVASASAETATQKATEAGVSASDANTYAKQSQSYAVGTGGARPGEATDNSKYYYEKSKDIYDNFSSSGDVTGVKGNAESTYRSGNVNLTKENIGLGNVDNTADLDKTVGKSLAMTTHLIPANADLNDYREVAGRYACFGDSTAVTILNRPSGARSFYMDLFRSNNNKTVIGTTGYGYLLQILYNIDGDRIWIRNYYGGSASEVQNKNWGEWRELYPPDRLKEFAVSTTENTIWSCGTNGIGYVKTENIGDPGFNVSEGALFQQRFSSDWIYRIFGDYRTGEMATRGWNNGVAQPWRIQIDSENVSGYAIRQSMVIPENSDLNDFNNHTHQGFWSCPLNRIADTIGHVPVAGAAFGLIVVATTSIMSPKKNGVVQIYFKYNSPQTSTYMRYCYDGVWGSWHAVITDFNIGNYALKKGNPFTDGLRTSSILFENVDDTSRAYPIIKHSYFNYETAKSSSIYFELQNNRSIIIECNDAGGQNISLYPSPGASTNRYYASLGTSTNNFSNIYSTNGTIQTSDARLKNDIADLGEEASVNFIMGLKPKSYKMNEGSSGRTHYGLIAQDIEELLQKLGLTSQDFAGFIKSPATRKVEKEITDKNGETKTIEIDECIEGEYHYSLRYDEFIAPMLKVIQTQQQEIKILSEQLNDVNKKIDALTDVK